VGGGFFIMFIYSSTLCDHENGSESEWLHEMRITTCCDIVRRSPGPRVMIVNFFPLASGSILALVDWKIRQILPRNEELNPKIYYLEHKQPFTPQEYDVWRISVCNALPPENFVLTLFPRCFVAEMIQVGC